MVYKFELKDVYTVTEAAEKWGVSFETVKSKLKSNSPNTKETLNSMINRGIIKYYTKPGGKQKIWFLTSKAMEEWFGVEKK